MPALEPPKVFTTTVTVPTTTGGIPNKKIISSIMYPKNNRNQISKKQLTPFEFCLGQWVSLGATAVDQGTDVATGTDEDSPDKCGQRCDKTTDCHSFAFCNEARGFVSCYLKDKILSDSETLNNPSNCASYKKSMFSCNDGVIESLIKNHFF